MTFSKPKISILKFDSEKIVTSAPAVPINDGVEAAKERAEANGYRAIEVDMTDICF